MRRCHSILRPSLGREKKWLINVLAFREVVLLPALNKSLPSQPFNQTVRVSVFGSVCLTFETVPHLRETKLVELRKYELLGHSKTIIYLSVRGYIRTIKRETI